MRALTKILSGSVIAASFVAAAPAAAQYYPGYGYGGNVVGQVLGSVLGGGYGYGGGGYGAGYGGPGYGANSQVVVGQCTNAVQARLGGGYGYNGAGYGGGRVLGISRVEPRSDGGLTVRGVATSGQYGGYGYNGQAPVDLTFKCKSDYRGYIVDVDIDRAQGSYGYNQPYNQPYSAPYAPYGTDYSAYGYRRY